MYNNVGPDGLPPATGGAEDLYFAPSRMGCYERPLLCLVTIWMKSIITTMLFSLCVALLCLAQSLSQLAQEHNLPDPAITVMSKTVTFNHFVCCGCYDRGPGSRTNSYFCSYKAVTTHIGRSVVCQKEEKGVRTVTMQYRPSGRAKDHEAGPVGAAPGA